MFVFLDDGQNIGKGKRRTLKREMGKNVREFWFSAGASFPQNRTVVYDK